MGGRAKEEVEFAEYFATHVARWRRTARFLSGSWHDADDLVQVAFVRLFSVWRRVKADSVDAYLRRILINVYLSSKRGQRGREVPVAVLPEVPAPDGVDGADRVALREALKALTPGQRRAVVLRYWEGLTVAETATVMGISEGTVKSQTARAVSALRPLVADGPAFTKVAHTSR
ncbi:RNA polymerase sigma-70 factor (sigma-E family) [Herbihabitans rhizosphaerae]|uniref:RNA polymerase sigma-70 factor (Sigma-E family) n=1 Tax=Herbihabitans rhizosphaerae TaxID=1872711 RepID=A0A4Q7KBG3_9PSEU|nr:SigE family RNA polymerase sigma factor [Herbihabitans rhizosphaerae]RZS29542.1 RNA polymerase sigma-70 factor (sigma-E family) [Herbihabitans rhizosphaerae]